MRLRAACVGTVAAALVLSLGAASSAPPGNGDPAGTVAPATAGEEATMEGFVLASPAFPDGGPIPSRFTADGADLSPRLEIRGAPEGTASFALIVDDPDAPVGTWVHWVAWNIPGGTTVIPEGALPEGAVEGTNSWGRTGWGGPSPPRGTGVHRYVFTLYALDAPLDLPASADKDRLLQAMEGHVLGRARLVGTYTRDR